MVGTSRGHSSSSVHSGLSQCHRGLSFSSSSDSELRVDPSRGRLSGSESSVAGDGGPVCHLSKSPLFYFSPFRDPHSARTDAFLQSWDGLQAYIFPPWSVIPQVLAELRASRGTFLTLVAPYWPQRPWFPELLDLAVAPPVVWPCRPDLLFQPLSGLRYPDLLRLRLHAWRLSGDSLVRQVSPQV